MDRKLLGRWGEQQAADFLRRKGYAIAGMNYSCRFGEIDVIAENREFLVFAEVKLRKDASHGTPREFVTRSKQEKLMAAAQLYLSLNPTQKQPRFDVIEIYAPRGAGGDIRINHIENAF